MESTNEYIIEKPVLLLDQEFHVELNHIPAMPQDIRITYKIDKQHLQENIRLQSSKQKVKYIPQV